MQLNGKDVKWFWRIIKIPTYILIAWVVLGFIVANFSFTTYTAIFGGFSSLMLQLGVFGFIGWLTVKDFHGTIKQGAISGALAGVITGFIGGIFIVLMVMSVPDIIEGAVQQAAAAGAPEEAVRQFVVLGSYLSVVTGPLFGALSGALIAAITAFIATKVKAK